MRRRTKLAAGVGVATLIGIGGLAYGFGGVARPGAAPAAASATPATAEVVRTTIESVQDVDGTLGYADAYAISNALATGGWADPLTAAQADAAARASYDKAVANLDALRDPTDAQLRAADSAVTAARAQLDVAVATLARPRGLLTWLPVAGAVVAPGATLYILDGSHPVVLMRGDVPAWRDLKAGVADGVDVTELETNLAALAFASDKLVVDERWDAETTAAVKRWQASLGLKEDGIVPLGEVVFQPDSIRVTTVRATLGDLVQAGTPMLDATSTTRQVTMALDADKQDIVSAGAAVIIELADGGTTSGTVAEIGTVAVAPKEGGTPQITVTVTLDDPAATGTLDGSPVTVEVVRDRHNDVLAVPIAALLALREGGYAVEVVDASGATHLVAVTTGLFENDLVEVSSSELAAGDRVVVPQ